MNVVRRLLLKTLRLSRSEIAKCCAGSGRLESHFAKADPALMLEGFHKIEELFAYETETRKRHIYALQRSTDEAEAFVLELKKANEEKQNTLERLSQIVGDHENGDPTTYTDSNELIERIEWFVASEKKHSAEMEEACHEAESAAATRSEFLANMSHEIRTPMNGILGTLNLLADSELTNDQRDDVDLILRSTKSLLTVLNDILDFSKIQEGRMTVESRPFDIAKTCRDIVNTFCVAANDKGIFLKLVFDDQAPRQVTGDEVRIRQIINNLIGNAVKFTAEGGVTLKVSLDQPTGNYLFEIIDSGIGLSKEIVDQLFIPFSQADRSTTREFGGTGLGLSISKNLAELMDGVITVDSRLGTGATFRFSLPLLTMQEGNSAEQDSSPAERRSSFSLIKPQQSLRILVAEDNSINQVVARKTLEKLGHSVVIAPDGVNAIEVTERELFDVILMDMEMPRMNGVESSKAIRAGATGNCDIPILAMTGNVLADSREECFAAGMTGFIPKPFDLVELGDKLNDIRPRKSAVRPPTELVS